MTPVQDATTRDGKAVLQVIDLAMLLGDRMLSAGMSANDVVVLMLRVTRAYGLRSVHVDLTYTSIAVTHYSGPDREPLTAVRVVQPTVVDYGKVRDYDVLVDRIEEGIAVDEARRAFEAISLRRHPYPRWVTSLASAGVGVGVVALFDTSWQLLLVTLVAGVFVDWVIRVGDEHRVPPFFQLVLASMTMVFFAAGANWVAYQDWNPLVPANANLVVVGGITMLLAGGTIVGAAQDAIDQFYVTASARLFEVGVRTAGIVVGIVLGLNLSVLWGFPITLSGAPEVAFGPAWSQYVAVVVIAASYAVWTYADLRTVALASAVTLVAWWTYLGAAAADGTEGMARAFGAFVAAFIATVLVRRTNMPGFGLITAALLPLLPGLRLYNGLMLTVTGPDGQTHLLAGGRALFAALTIALGLAAGATLGTYLGRPVRSQLRRMRQRVGLRHRLRRVRRWAGR